EGDLAGARALLESVAASLCDLVGSSDPDTLAALGNLAGVLWQEGECEAAYALQLAVVEERRRGAGAGDAATVAAEAALAAMERGFRL
ncbi:MAG TPA: hypothetical protein VGR91_09560, partial [Stellaceae bacterium]|nr:hypothetical protein [Stellaceae bacterium]